MPKQFDFFQVKNTEITVEGVCSAAPNGSMEGVCRISPSGFFQGRDLLHLLVVV